MSSNWWSRVQFYYQWIYRVKGYKNYQVIKYAKDLRFSMDIDEKSVCYKCSKKDSCKFKDEVPENNKKA